MDKNSLSVIDEAGQTVSTETREKIHREGLLHREVHIFFVTPKGEIIFQHRSKTKDTCPDLLDATAGGHVEIGSDFEKSAQKEVFEETGLSVEISKLKLIKVIRLTHFDPATNTKNNVLRAIFMYKYEGKSDDLKQEEGKGVGFEAFKMEKLNNLRESEKIRFVPRMLDDTYLSLFKEMLKNVQ